MGHRHRSRWFSAYTGAGVLAALVVVGSGLLDPGRLAHAQAQPVKLEWLSWSFFRFTSPTGKVILTNPFMTGNPDATVTLADITRADLILVPERAP